VPAPVHSHTTPRVLTMTWYAAVPVSDRRRLLELRVDHRSVIQTIARAYAKQVFVDGLFHADPHPGNVLVIDEPTAARNPRVLFIDFGLSRRLAPELRHELRAGIYALMKRDVDAFVDGMERLSMIAPGARPGVRKVVEDMFDQIATAGGALGTSGDRILALKSEAKKLLQRTPGLQLPADLLLYAKTVTYVFALGANIAPDVDVMKLSAPYLLKFLATAG
jgi:predicted unusual protein kinase regulating ubiquinone biosynthesis (AarF/ABC1/UbiB family)